MKTKITRNLKFLSVLFVGVLFSSTSYAIEKENNIQMQEELKNVVQLNTTVMQFRNSIMMNPAKDVSGFFHGLTKVRWKNMIKELEVEPIFLSDFFTGALRMTGPYNSDTAISGLYNPWWDAILLLKAQHKDANKWNFVSFVLMSGEDFRKESANTIPAFDSVVASKGPQALAWMKLIKKTRDVFNKTFASGNILTEKFDDKVLKSSLKPMMLRAALRMKLHQDVLGRPGIQKEMLDYLLLLRKATPKQMQKVFNDDTSLQAFVLFCAMGKSFRQTMTYYGCWISENDRLYMYISKFSPQIVAVVHVQVNKAVEFEWYDLNESEKFLQAAETLQNGGLK